MGRKWFEENVYHIRKMMPAVRNVLPLKDSFPGASMRPESPNGFPFSRGIRQPRLASIERASAIEDVPGRIITRAYNGRDTTQRDATHRLQRKRAVKAARDKRSRFTSLLRGPGIGEDGGCHHRHHRHRRRRHCRCRYQRIPINTSLMAPRLTPDMHGVRITANRILTTAITVLAYKSALNRTVHREKLLN